MDSNSEKALRHSLFSLKTSMIFTMTIALLSIGFVIFFFFFSNRIIKIIQEEIPFKIILKSQKTLSHDVFILIDSLKMNPAIHVDKIKFISKEKAVEQLKNKLGDNFLDPLNHKNPLPDIINLYIKADYHNSRNLEELQEMAQSYPIVTNIIFPIQISDKLIKLKLKFLKISFFVSVIFLILSVFLIHNNIRLSIYSNRYNLKVMQLVGATKKFIQRPFLKNSILDGFLAALISIIILTMLIFIILYITFENNKIVIEQILNVFNFMEISLFGILIILLGVTISFISHWLVLKKILSLKINLYK